ncbi:hypothetical protein ACHAPT_013529 [Fusarium lateritium]
MKLPTHERHPNSSSPCPPRSPMTTAENFELTQAAYLIASRPSFEPPSAKILLIEGSDAAGVRLIFKPGRQVPKVKRRNHSPRREPSTRHSCILFPEAVCVTNSRASASLSLPAYQKRARDG